MIRALHGASGKEPARQCRRHKRHRYHPWVRKIPWRRAWQTTPIFLSGESHGQRSQAGYSTQGCKESDMTESTQHTNRIRINAYQDENTAEGYNISDFCNACIRMCSVTQSCPTLCDSMNSKPPGSAVRGIFQARILEWVAIAYSV